MSAHTQLIERIDQLFVEGELPPREWQRLQTHLKTCEQCRNYYDQAARLSLSLGGSFLSAANIEADVLARTFPKAPHKLQRGFFWGLFATAAALVLFVWVGGSSPQSFEVPDGEAPNAQPTLQARGALSDAAPARLRPLCTTQSNALSGDTIPVKKNDDEKSPAGDNGRVTYCSMQSELMFTYTFEGETSKTKYLFMVGFDQRGFPLWYTPRPNEKESGPVAVLSKTTQRVPGAIRVGVNHIPGKVRVFGIFSQTPISIEEVSLLAQKLRVAKVDITSLSELPLNRGDLLTMTADLEVSP